MFLFILSIRLRKSLSFKLKHLHITKFDCALIETAATQPIYDPRERKHTGINLKIDLLSQVQVQGSVLTENKQYHPNGSLQDFSQEMRKIFYFFNRLNAFQLYQHVFY